MNMIEWIKNLIVEYGGVNVLIMGLTILFTNLIKKPIKDKAQKLTDTAKTLLGVDLDKSIITSNIVYIPIGVAFILYLLYSLIIIGFKFAMLNWGELVSNALIYGMLSVSLFDIVKSKLNAYKSKDKYEEVKNRLNETKQIIDEPKSAESELNEPVEITNSTEKITADGNEHDLVVKDVGSVESTQNIKKENIV